MRLRPRQIMLAAVALAAAQIACALPGTNAQPTPTIFAIPTQPASGNATTAQDSGAETNIEEPTAEVPYFDPCELLTQDEATAALGSPAQAEAFGMAAAFGGCQYNNADYSQVVSVNLLTGEDARSLISLAAVLAPMSGTPDVAQQGADFITRMENMSLAEILTEIRTDPAWQAEDDPDAEAVAGLGDAAFWRWHSDENKGELEVVQGQHYVMVSLTGKPEAEARPILEGLLQTALSRIPTTPFSTLNVPQPTESPTVLP